MSLELEIPTNRGPTRPLSLCRELQLPRYLFSWSLISVIRFEKHLMSSLSEHCIYRFSVYYYA